MIPCLATLLILAMPTSEPDEGSLRVALEKRAASHEGKVAFALLHLGSGESAVRDGDAVMPTASLIKIAVMAEVYFQVAENILHLDDKLTLTKDDMVPGSGILTEHFSAGATFTLRDAVRLMIAFSDNTATNLILDKVGIKNVNARMAKLGLKETRINAKVFKGKTTSVDPDRTAKYGLGSTTANETIALLKMLHEGKLVSEEAGKSMLEHLKKCDDKDKFPRHLPKGVTLAHKTGSVNEARTDAGILYFAEGPVALVVLTSGNEDKSWTADNAGNQCCADIAAAVVKHYREKAKK